MILVDTAIWIDHLHRSEHHLTALLERNDVATHELIIGELALGSIARRGEVLGAIGELRRLAAVSHDDLLSFLQARLLFGRGLSLVDAHLLASTLATPGTAIWTRDRRLHECAEELGVAWAPPA